MLEIQEDNLVSIRNATDELRGAREKALDDLLCFIPPDDLYFLKNECAQVVIDEIKRDKLALLFGEYHYRVPQDDSENRSLAKAIVLKRAFEEKGLTASILAPKSSLETSSRRVYTTTIIISGW